MPYKATRRKHLSETTDHSAHERGFHAGDEAANRGRGSETITTQRPPNDGGLELVSEPSNEPETIRRELPEVGDDAGKEARHARAFAGLDLQVGDRVKDLVLGLLLACSHLDAW